MTLRWQIESFLTQANRTLIEHARRHRKIYTVAALTLFISGMIVSITAIDLDTDNFGIHWLLLNLFIGAPVAIALNANGLQFSARMLGTSIPFVMAFRTCCMAICSNVLPIPAGSVFHTSALVSRGGKVLDSGLIVILGNVISLSLMLMLAGGSILSLTGSLLGTGFLLTGLAGLALCITPLLSRTTSRLTTAFVGLRLLRTLVMVARIQISFAMIGLMVALLDAAVFTAAVSLGTTVAVVPSGLGISESLAAVLAVAIGIAPGAAFLATALNRISTLAFAGLAAMALNNDKKPLE